MYVELLRPVEPVAGKDQTHGTPAPFHFNFQTD